MLQRWPARLRLLRDGESVRDSAGNELEVWEWTLVSQRMGTSSVEASMVWPKDVDALLDSGVYVEIDGERYILDEHPSCEMGVSTSGMVKYSLKFQNERDCILGNTYFYDAVPSGEQEGDKPVSGGTSFSLYGKLSEFAARLGASLRYRGLSDYTVVVDDGVESGETMLSFEDRTFLEALQDAYGAYGVPYWFSGKEIHFGWGSGVLGRDFAYGRDRELTRISLAPSGVSRFTSVAPRGSSENLPEYYPNEGPNGRYGWIENLEGCSLEVSDQVLLQTLTKPGDTLTAGKPDAPVLVPEQCFMSPKYKTFPVEPEVPPGPTASDTGDYFYYASRTEGQSATMKAARSRTKYISQTGGPVKVTNTLSEILVRVTFTAAYAGDYRISFRIDNSDLIPSLFSSYHYDVVTGQVSDRKSGEGAKDAEGVTVSHTRHLVSGVNSFVFQFLVNVKETAGSEFSFTLAGMKAEADFHAFKCPDGVARLPEQLGLHVVSGTLTSGSITILQSKARIPSLDRLTIPQYAETGGKERFVYAKDDTYLLPDGSGYYRFENKYTESAPREAIRDFEDIKPGISGIVNAAGEAIDSIAADALFDLGDKSQKGEDDAPAHARFAVRLRTFDGYYPLNIFAHASARDEMALSFTSGPCAGCTFKVVVTDGTRRNPLLVGADGLPQRSASGDLLISSVTQDRQNDTSGNSVWLLLEKDTETFSTALPDPAAGIIPKAGDTFVITGITLPMSYISAAEERLMHAGLQWLVENNADDLQPSVSLSRIYLSGDDAVCGEITPSSTVYVEHEGQRMMQYVTQLTVKKKRSEVLPEVSISIAGTVKDDKGSLYRAVESMVSQMKAVSGAASVDIEGVGSRLFVSRSGDDTVEGTLKMLSGLSFGLGGSFIKVLPDGSTRAVFDSLVVNRDASVSQVTVDDTKAVSGRRILTSNACRISSVEETEGGYICTYETDSESGGSSAALFEEGDLLFSGSTQGFGQRFWWRRVISAEPGSFTLSRTDCKEGSAVPADGDYCLQLGNDTDSQRQSAMVVNSCGQGSPKVVFYSGIDSYSLAGKDTAAMVTGEDGSPALYCYGDFFFGDRNLQKNFITFQRKEGESDRSLFLSGGMRIGAGSEGLTNLSEWAGKQEQMDSATKGLADIDSDLVLTPVEKRSIADALSSISERMLATGEYYPAFFDVITIVTGNNQDRLEWNNGEYLRLDHPSYDLFVKITFRIHGNTDTHFRFIINSDETDSSSMILVSQPDDMTFTLLTQEEREEQAYGVSGGGGEDTMIDITGLSAGEHFVIIQAHKTEASEYLGCYYSITESEWNVRGSLWDWYRRCLLLDGDDKDYYQVTYADPAFDAALLLFSLCSRYRVFDTGSSTSVPETFRSDFEVYLRRFNEAINRLVAGTSDDDVAYLKKAFSDGETVISGGVVMSEAVAVRNSEGEVEGMLNGSDNFEDGTHGKAIIISGIPAVSSSGSTDLLSRVMEAETIQFEDGTIKTRKLQAEAGTFSGVLKAVSGSFKSLSCLDADGNELGYISFGTQGTVDFTGFNLRHDGTFRSNNIFCRGTLGARSRTAVVITGTSGKYYYNGLENTSDYITVNFTSDIYDGKSLYYVPLYGTGALAYQYGSEIAGMPVDIVIIRISDTTLRRYCFTAPMGKKFTVVNANDDNNNIYIYSNGTAVQMTGGSVCEMINIGYANMLPAQTSDVPGAGQMIISKNDNNW